MSVELSSLAVDEGVFEKQEPKLQLFVNEAMQSAHSETIQIRGRLTISF